MAINLEGKERSVKDLCKECKSSVLDVAVIEEWKQEMEADSCTYDFLEWVQIVPLGFILPLDGSDTHYTCMGFD
jgi:hypothetical protein